MSNVVELDSQLFPMCTLLHGGNPSHRQCGVVFLEQQNETAWVLAVKTDGLTVFTYKPQQRKVGRNEVKTRRIAREETVDNLAIIWSPTTEQDWSLEFTGRNGWSLFKEKHEECYNRNFLASLGGIPVPMVREVDDNNLTSTVDIPFERPMNYIKTADDQVSRALTSGRAVYDMDSDDEEWLRQFNDNIADSDGKETNKITQDVLEGVLDRLEKVAFLRKCDCLTVNDALEVCSGLAEVEVLTLIHAHWMKKRRIKGAALVQEYQTSQSKRGEKRGGKRGEKRGGNYFTIGSSKAQKRGNVFKRQAHRGAHCEVGTSNIAWNLDEKDTAELDLIRAACAAREYAVAKRAEAERLMRIADLATYKAVAFTRKAELIGAIEKARSRGCDISERSYGDNMVTENVSTDEASMSSPSSEMGTNSSSPFRDTC